MNDKLIKLHLSEVKTNIKVSLIFLNLGFLFIMFMEFSRFLLGCGFISLVISAVANFTAAIKIISRYLFDEDSAIIASIPYSPKEILKSKIYASIILTAIYSIISFVWCDIMLLLSGFPMFDQASSLALSVVAEVTNQAPAVVIATSSFVVQITSIFSIVSFSVALQMIFLKRQAKRSPQKCYNPNTRPTLIGAYILVAISSNLITDLISKSALVVGGFPVKVIEFVLLSVVVGLLSLAYAFRNLDNLYKVSPHFYRKGDDIL